MISKMTHKEIVEIIDRDFGMLELLENAPFLWTLSNDRGFFIKGNKVWEEITGFTVKEMCDVPLINFVHPEDIERTMKAYFNTKHFNDDGDEITGFVNRYACKDGKWAKLEWHSTGKAANGVALSIAIFKNYEQSE